jgi:hypothetical protein
LSLLRWKKIDFFKHAARRSQPKMATAYGISNGNSHGITHETQQGWQSTKLIPCFGDNRVI